MNSPGSIFTRFSSLVALASLLLTLVVAQGIWESYYPPLDREALRQRRAYYEKVLKKADISWQEGLYYEKKDSTEITP